MKISFLFTAGVLLSFLIASSAWAQPRGKVTLQQVSPTCNIESFRDANDLDDDVPVAPCVLQATVRDAGGRSVSAVSVQLFAADEDVGLGDTDDDVRPVNEAAFGPAAGSRTNRAGNANFAFQPPETEICFQARTDRNATNRQVASLRSDVLCISTDDTVAVSRQTGAQTVVAE